MLVLVLNMMKRPDRYQETTSPFMDSSLLLE